MVDGGAVFQAGARGGLVDETWVAGKARGWAVATGATLGVAYKAVAVEWEVAVGAGVKAAALEEEFA